MLTFSFTCLKVYRFSIYKSVYRTSLQHSLLQHQLLYSGSFTSLVQSITMIVQKLIQL